MARMHTDELKLNTLHKRLLNDYQHDFPLSPRPFAKIAQQLNTTEDEVLEALQALTDESVISRLGAVFRPHQVGTSTLAAMAIPQPLLQKVADYISALPEVNHNYEREHRFNLWFVLTASDEEHLTDVLAEIEAHTGFKVMSLPMLEDYHIDLGFKLEW